MAKRELTYEFTWPVSRAGHAWVQALPASGTSLLPGRYLIGGSLVIGSEDQDLSLVELTAEDMCRWPPGETEFVDDAPFMRRPLEASGLFLRFAGLKPTEEDIASFADDYGFLGGPVTVDVLIDCGSGRPESGSGESLGNWAAEIGSMHALVELWKASLAGEQQIIKDCLPRAMRVWATDLTVEDLILRHGVRIRAAGTAQQLREAAEISLKQALQRKLRGRLSLIFSADELVPQPDSLLGALWLQFAQAVAQRKQYRQCESCAKWFEISPQVARTNRVFCSTACRSRAYRQRQEQARRLDAEGVPIDQIARELQSDVETVSGWTKSKTAPSPPQ